MNYLLQNNPEQEEESGDREESERSSELEGSKEQKHHHQKPALMPSQSTEEETPSAKTSKISKRSEKSVPTSSASDSLDDKEADPEYIPSTSVEPSTNPDIITTQEGLDTSSTEISSDDDFEAVPINALRKRGKTRAEILEARIKAGYSPAQNVMGKSANPISDISNKIEDSPSKESSKVKCSI